MKLIVANNTISNPTLPIRWCLEENDLTWIKEKVQMDLHLIIVMTRGKFYKSAEARYLVPLDQLMEYLVFDHPGEWKLNATVLMGKYIDLSNTFLRRKEGRYETDVYDYGYEKLLMPRTWRDSGYDPENSISASLEINVPKEIFAKEPPEWEKKWVNRYFAEKPHNQCAYRKRRFFAYTLQVPIFLISLPFLAMFKAVETSTKTISDLYKKSFLKKWRERIAQKTWNERIAHASRQEAMQKTALERKLQEYTDIVCNGNFAVTLEALPKRKRTIYLRYEDLKMKVCKPFAR